MLVYKTGDILKATENIICHQVNVQGVMGGGLAKQIASSYPNVEKEYKKLCRAYDYDYIKLQGKAQKVKINDNQYIANCFTQFPNFDTDYKAIRSAIRELIGNCKTLNQTIAVPYKYGCGIANGEWEKVEIILRYLSVKYGKDIVIYKLED